MMQKQAIKLHTRWNDDGAAADEHDDETGPAKKPGALGAEPDDGRGDSKVETPAAAHMRTRSPCSTSPR